MPRLSELLAERGLELDVHLRRIESPEAAAEERFLGSPTLRVDGADIEPGALKRTDFGLKCRLYRQPNGRTRALPPEEWIEAALERAATANVRSHESGPPPRAPRPPHQWPTYALRTQRLGGRTEPLTLAAVIIAGSAAVATWRAR